MSAHQPLRLFSALLLALPASVALAVIEHEPQEDAFLYNEALFHHYSDQHASTISALELGISRGEIAPDDRKARLLYADSLLGYGLYQEALAVYRALLAERRGLSRTERAEIWLRIARYEFERGYLDAVETTLTEMAADVGGRNARDRLELLGLSQLRGGNPQLAIDTFRTGGFRRKSDFAQYNLAMAYFQSGNIKDGRKVLDNIGTRLVNDPIEHALRDRTNLVLAYNYLAEANGEKAKPVLQRLQLEGPFSERALLGMGWAEIAIDEAKFIRRTESETQDTIGGVLGVILRPGQVDNQLYDRLGMKRAIDLKPKVKAARFERALVPWLELHGRNSRNPATMEVLLAIPYVLMELGDVQQASEFYESAVRRLSAARADVDKAIEGVRTGRMVETMIRRDRDLEAGWTWRLRDLPNAPETYYLSWLLGENRFQEALKNYRDLRQLQRSSTVWLARLEGYREGVGLASIRPEVLIEQARRGRSAIYGRLEIELGLETELNRYPRNETIEGLLAWSYRFAAPRNIRLATETPQFAQRSAPKISEVQPQLRALLDEANAVLKEQRALLERVAVGELEAQKTRLTRYLIDARFALARIYDQVEVPSADDGDLEP